MVVAAAAARVAACHPKLLVCAPHLVHLLLGRRLERVGLVYGTGRDELDAVDADDVLGERVGGGRHTWLWHVGGDSDSGVERDETFCAAGHVAAGVVDPGRQFCVGEKAGLWGGGSIGGGAGQGRIGGLVENRAETVDGVIQGYRHWRSLCLARRGR